MALQDITQAYSFANCYIQRFSSNFGINTAPTTVELTLIPGDPNNTEDVAGTYVGGGANNITGYNFTYGQPGALSGFEIGSFQFVGLIESYEYNLSDAGQTYTVRMSDPRFVLENATVVLDPHISFDQNYITSSGLRNYLDIYHLYDGSAGDFIQPENGIPFSKIRNYLSAVTNGFVTVNGHDFRLSFDGSFDDFSLSNISGIPSWYRITDSTITLSNLIQKVASDFNKDWYAYVDYDAWQADPDTTQILHIKGISRNATDPAELTNHINDLISDGTMKSYKSGVELRKQPSTIVITGPPELQWKGLISSDLEHFWGYDNNYGLALTSPLGSNTGIVLLDHIQGQIADEITSTVTIVGSSYVKEITSEIYPPIVSGFGVYEQVRGYYPTYTIFDAALYNQESWETAIYQENPAFAASIGITENRFRTFPEYTDYASGLVASGHPSGLLTKAMGISLIKTGEEFDDRTNVEEALISAVYSATQSVASNHYGITWLANSIPSVRTRALDPIPTGWVGTHMYPIIDYEVVSEGWMDPDEAYPYSLPNMTAVYATSNSTFKNRDGRSRAFLAMNPSGHMIIRNDSQSLTGPLDTTLVDKNQSFTSGSVLFLPLSLATYKLDPSKVVITLPNPLQAVQFDVTGYAKEKSYNTWLRYMGYDQDIILEREFLTKPGNNITYGMFPPRGILPSGDFDGFLGFAIPIQDNYKPYGPFMDVATSDGVGTKVVNDSSLTPWTYGSRAKMVSAAYDYLSQNITQSLTMGSAQITKAGLPDVNVGQKLAYSTVTSLGLQIGSDGLTTNYSLRTFAFPTFRIDKTIGEKAALAYTKDSNKQSIIDLDIIDPGKDEDKIYKSDQIKKAAKPAGSATNATSMVRGTVNKQGRTSR